jgi:hypothetical protein
MANKNRTAKNANEVKTTAAAVVETAPASEVAETVAAPAPITDNPETVAATNEPDAVPAPAPATETKESDEAKPEPKKSEYIPVRAPLFRTIGNRDSYGFGEGTETSFLLALLAEGKRTRAELLAAFLEKYATNEAETKKKKTSFSVFFSDVRRPIGTYHASRSLIILIEEGTERLSLDSDRAEKVRAAIAAGILSELRGTKPGGTKAAAVLTKYGLPIA